MAFTASDMEEGKGKVRRRRFAAGWPTGPALIGNAALGSLRTGGHDRPRRKPGLRECIRELPCHRCWITRSPWLPGLFCRCLGALDIASEPVAHTPGVN